MPNLLPDTSHQHLLDRAPRILRYDIEDYFPEWQSAVRRSFKQLLGLMPARLPTNVQILSEEKSPTLRSLHFTFTAEPGSIIQATLKIPLTAPTPTPLAISFSPENTATDFPAPLADHTATLTFNLRSTTPKSPSTADPALTALLLGRTMIGQRVFDISRALDALTEHFPEIDPQRIYLLGPTIAYYAAAFDPRIAAVLTTNIAPFKSTLALHPHPPEAYIPNLLHYFELSDLAGLIFPRPLLILAEQNNPLYPIPSVQESFSEIQTIYTNQNTPTSCQLITSPSPFPTTALWNTFQALLH